MENQPHDGHLPLLKILFSERSPILFQVYECFACMSAPCVFRGLLLHGFWEVNTGSLKEPQELLTDDPPPWHRHPHFNAE